MTEKRLYQKLERIKADPSGNRDFMICDAKDSDMGFGRAHTGPVRDTAGQPSGRFRSRATFLEQIRQIVRQDLIDLMLMSVWTLDQLAIGEQLFADSAVATAIRANDTTDVWAVRHGAYVRQPSIPFATAVLGHAQKGTDLGLYSVTFTNDAEADHRSLAAYRDFRLGAEAAGFRHFLEVFNPNAACDVPAEDVGEFVNDCIIRCLAGVAGPARPLFLKLVYNGPRALEELVSYDPSLVVGILGGGAGTTHDCFRLIHDVHKYGGRLALFGRKINLSEHPLALIALMRHVVEGEIKSDAAVRAYHSELDKAGIAPARRLDDDLLLTERHLV